MKFNEDDITISYCAGLFDGEGSACISKVRKISNIRNYQYQAVLRLSMTDKQPIVILQNCLGGNIFFKGKQRLSEAPMWAWQVSGRKAAEVGGKLLPYLKIERKIQAVKCIMQFAATIHPDGTKYLSLSSLLRREQLYQRCQQLNKKGIDKPFAYFEDIITQKVQLELF